MKKIIISNYDDIKNPYYGGGGAIALHELARRLAPEYQITIITGMYPQAKNEQVDGVRYQRIGTTLVGPKLGQLVFQALLPFYLMTKSYDLWMESFTPPFSTAFLQLFTRKPVIGIVHMLSGEDMVRKYKLPFHLIERIGVRFYNYFIVPTEYLKDKISQLNPHATITVIPNGIILPEKSIVKKNDRCILFLGRIEINQKGLDLLLSAYSRIKDTTAYPMIIAGAGTRENEKELHRLLTSLQLADRVRIIGRVDGMKKAALLRQAICIVIPSRFESFGMVALEAYSHGVPVITFDLPMLTWMHPSCTIKVRPFAPAALAQEIVRLTNDSQLRGQMSKHARRFATGFQWEEIVAIYKASIERTLTNAHPILSKRRGNRLPRIVRFGH